MSILTDAQLIARLRSQAETVSKISREMAEAKSLRQYDNPEGRTDLYEWPTAEQTLEGQAADRLAALSAPQSITPPERVSVRKIETVTGDFLTDPGEPFWRIEIDGFCADFDHEQAANNFANAISARITPPEVGGELVERKAVNTILAKLLTPLIPDFIERIRIGNQACTEIIAALSTPEVVDGTAGLVEALESIRDAASIHSSTFARAVCGIIDTALSQHRGVS